jgi:hypothetical protein
MFELLSTFKTRALVLHNLKTLGTATIPALRHLYSDVRNAPQVLDSLNEQIETTINALTVHRSALVRKFMSQLIFVLLKSPLLVLDCRSISWDDLDKLGIRRGMLRFNRTKLAENFTLAVEKTEALMLRLLRISRFVKVA